MLPILLEGHVRLLQGPEVADALEGGSQMLARRPHGLHAHSHAHLVEGTFLDQREEGDVGPVEQHVGADEGQLELDVLGGHPHDAEGGDRALAVQRDVE